MGNKQTRSTRSTAPQSSGCGICEHFYDCRSIVRIRKKHSKEPDLEEYDLPDLSLIDILDAAFFPPVKVKIEEEIQENAVYFSNDKFSSFPVTSPNDYGHEEMSIEDTPYNMLRESLKQLRDPQRVQRAEIEQSPRSSSDQLARHSSFSNNLQDEDTVGLYDPKQDLLNTKATFAPEQNLKPSKKGLKKMKKELKRLKKQMKIVKGDMKTPHDHSDIRAIDDSSNENNPQDEDMYGNEQPTPYSLSNVQTTPVPKVHDLRPLKIKLKLSKPKVKKPYRRIRQYVEESSNSSSGEIPRNSSSPINNPQDKDSFRFEKPAPDFFSETSDDRVFVENIFANKKNDHQHKIPHEETPDGTPLDVFAEILTSVTEHGKKIDNVLAEQLEYFATNGLTHTSRKELIYTYPVPSNCVRIGAPILNAEVRAALPESIIKWNNLIETRQKVLAKAISSLASAVTDQMSKDDINQGLLKKLMDTGRLLCDMQYADSIARRDLALLFIERDHKEQLCNTKIDKYLFGKTLSEAEERVNPESTSGDENHRMVHKNVKLSYCSSGSGDTKDLKSKYNNTKIKALENVGKTNIQMSKAASGPSIPTKGSDAIISSIIPYQVQILRNPFDEGSNYFKDDGASCSWQEPSAISLNKTIPVDDHCTNIKIQEIEAMERAGVDQCNVAIKNRLKNKKVNIIRKGFPQIPRKKVISDAQLKRIFFRKKIQNALLQHKKLEVEIFHHKQEHRLKMLLLRKQFDNLN